MKFIFYTLLILWVLFKLFGKTNVVNYTFNMNASPKEPAKKEGEVTIKKVNKKNKETSEGDDGEYVDYEEIKN